VLAYHQFSADLSGGVYFGRNRFKHSDVMPVVSSARPVQPSGKNAADVSLHAAATREGSAHGTVPITPPCDPRMNGATYGAFR